MDATLLALLLTADLSPLLMRSVSKLSDRRQCLRIASGAAVCSFSYIKHIFVGVSRSSPPTSQASRRLSCMCAPVIPLLVRLFCFSCYVPTATVPPCAHVHMSNTPRCMSLCTCTRSPVRHVVHYSVAAPVPPTRSNEKRLKLTRNVRSYV